MRVAEDAHALKEILDINPDEPNIQPEEKKNRIKLQMEKIRFLQEKREQWQREHLQKVYAEVPVSYTHLDVYKRQLSWPSTGPIPCMWT